VSRFAALVQVMMPWTCGSSQTTVSCLKQKEEEVQTSEDAFSSKLEHNASDICPGSVKSCALAAAICFCSSSAILQAAWKIVETF